MVFGLIENGDMIHSSISIHSTHKNKMKRNEQKQKNRIKNSHTTTTTTPPSINIQQQQTNIKYAVVISLPFFFFFSTDTRLDPKTTAIPILLYVPMYHVYMYLHKRQAYGISCRLEYTVYCIRRTIFIY